MKTYYRVCYVYPSDPHFIFEGRWADSREEAKSWKGSNAKVVEIEERQFPEVGEC